MGLFATPALAVIDVAGDVLPNYPGVDPWHVDGPLYVADTASFGSMSINGSSDVIGTDGYIAYGPGTTGVVSVDGFGSTWINGGMLSVGNQGHGTLAVRNGGFVSSTGALLGGGTDGFGAATVRGNGSSWVNNGALHLGQDGSAKLKIAEGGVVSASNVTINATSLLSIEAADRSELNLESGNAFIANNGTVRMIARAAAQSDTVFLPIQASDWMGPGTYEAVGGQWNNVTHEFTVSSVEHGTSGTAVSIDLASQQRVLFEDPVSGWSVGASFLAMANSSQLGFTATAASEPVLDDLKELLEHNEVIGGAWEFGTNVGANNIPGDLAYLSFDIGSGHIPNTLRAWHHDGEGWSEYDAPDFIYDGRYASFAVSGFSYYCMTMSLIPGDVTGDGFVDVADATTLANNWGLDGDWADGDMNGDGKVGISDASILAANWGYTWPESAAVPEPGVIVMLLIGAPMLLVRRRR